jgi:hypothetical protein
MNNSIEYIREAMQLRAANQHGILQDNFIFLFRWFQSVFGEPIDSQEYFFEWLLKYKRGFLFWFQHMDEPVRIRTVEFLLSRYQLILPEISELKESLIQARFVVKAKTKALNNHLRERG